MPFAKLAIADNLTKLRDRFEVKNVSDLGDGEAGFRLDLGTFEYEGETTLIYRLSVEERRVVLQIGGSSGAANACFAELEALFEEIGWERQACVLIAEETKCVAELDFDADMMFAPGVREFLSNTLPHFVERDDAETLVSPTNFRVEVLYRVTSDDLTSQHLTLAPKLFIVEPRAHTLREERKYFCHSPTGSVAHIRLIEAFEKSVLSEAP